MPPSPSFSPSEAFDLLDHAVQVALTEAQADIGKAATGGEYAKAGELLKAAQELEALRKDLRATEKAFNRLVEPDDEPGEGSSNRIRRGLKTPQEAYRVPILQALVELGGRSDLQPVLDRVYEIMKGQLNEHDLALLPSDGVTPRWRNTAQWERNSLREEGLLRDDSPHGTWEISEQGRQLLKEHEGSGRE
jgi:hypothetical protein